MKMKKITMSEFEQDCQALVDDGSIKSRALGRTGSRRTVKRTVSICAQHWIRDGEVGFLSRDYLKDRLRKEVKAELRTMNPLMMWLMWTIVKIVIKRILAKYWSGRQPSVLISDCPLGVDFRLPPRC